MKIVFHEIFRYDGKGFVKVKKKKKKIFAMWKLGCGVVAMSDTELYLTQQNVGYSSPNEQIIAYDTSTGAIKKDDYMKYAEYNRDYTYPLKGTLSSYVVGVFPNTMENGLENYFRQNNHPETKVTWAPNSYMGKIDEKVAVAENIETMIENDLPVGFFLWLTWYSVKKCANINLYVARAAGAKERKVSQLWKRKRKKPRLKKAQDEKYMRKSCPGSSQCSLQWCWHFFWTILLLLMQLYLQAPWKTRFYLEQG